MNTDSNSNELVSHRLSLCCSLAAKGAQESCMSHTRFARTLPRQFYHALCCCQTALTSVDDVQPMVFLVKPVDGSVGGWVGNTVEPNGNETRSVVVFSGGSAFVVTVVVVVGVPVIPVWHDTGFSPDHNRPSACPWRQPKGMTSPQRTISSNRGTQSTRQSNNEYDQDESDTPSPPPPASPQTTTTT